MENNVSEIFLDTKLKYYLSSSKISILKNAGNVFLRSHSETQMNYIYFHLLRHNVFYSRRNNAVKERLKHI